MRNLIGRKFADAEKVFHSKRMVFGLWSLIFGLWPLLSKTIPITRIKGQSPKTKDLLLNKKAATRAALHNSFCCRSFHDYDPFILVKLRQHHFDYLTLLGWHKFADVVRLNRQFAVFVTAID